MFILTFVRNIVGIIVFSIFYGIAFGGRNPLFTSIRGDYFDRTVFATFFGLSGLIINIGTVSSPVLTGYLFDTKGDYSIAFFILGIKSSSNFTISHPMHFLLSELKIVLPLLSWILSISIGVTFFPPLTNVQ